MFIIPQSIKNNHKLSKAFTLIELLIVITIIGILSGLLIVSISGVEERAKDSRIKSEMSQIRNIADIYKINNGFSYEELETNQEVSSLLSSITSQGGTAESNISISNDGSQYCIFTNLNSTNDLWCVDNTGYSGLGGCEEETYTCNSSIVGEGTTPEDIGFVENLSILHDAQYIDLVWAIPSSLTSTLSSSMISSAIVCVNSTEQISEPTDEDILNNGTLIDVINNANQEYRITVDNPDWYYYCKVFSYNNTTITNPGTIGGSVNTSFSTGGFSYPTSSGGSGGEPTTSNYYVSSQSTSNPLPAQNPPSLSGSTASGSSTTPNFTVSSERDPETGTGSITLSWTPGYLSTHTIIRRDVNTSPVSRTDGVEVYNQRNDSNNQDPTSIHYHTDNGLLDNTLYCYSAWAYDERTNTYSNGYVLVCGGISPSNPGNLLLTSNLDSITLSWTKGSSTNSVIRRAINTPPQNQNQGVLIYNQTESSFTDNSLLVANTTYCYSVWAYNPITGTFSDEYLSGCGSLLEQGDDPVLSPTNLTFPSVAYNSIVLNWAKGTGATKTLIVRKEGSIPLNKDDGTVVYLNIGNSFIDTNLSANTTYCYSLYSTNNEEDYYGSIGDCEQTLTKDTQSAPEAPTMNTATQTSIILNECSNGGCQYRMNSGTWQTSTTFSDLTANTSYSFTQRKAETESHFASEESSSASFSTAPKDTQSAPEAPTMNTATQTSIILNECSNGGCQYRMNSGTWQTS
ncbi:MAG: prepilin-type N-terminal cleavage/methylation domain-containing protein, partial [Candidatus Pacebacteria bacterium]|nr:prepilin-type N-terminal cleavage/methylation domain-containing protein [Candidatus Paceibacterota bacterium]